MQAKQHNTTNSPNGQSTLKARAFAAAFIPEDNPMTPAQAITWLRDKIEFYEAEVAEREAELKHARILLNGHLTWLADLERKAGAR